MYRVSWTRRAINQLAAIWANATDRNAIAAASYAIDQALANDPENEGESRPNGQRVTYALPLGVRFRVDPIQRRVRVVACWYVR